MAIPDRIQVDAEVRRCNAIRDQLRAEYDGIDEATLADTVEGLVNLHELLTAIVRGALDDEAMIEAIKLRVSDMTARLARLRARAERRRQIVREAMADAHINKLTVPDFTASLRPSPPHVVITDESLIPKIFFEQIERLKKRELGEAMKDGAEVTGAALSNPEMVLSVRTK
jgi:Siphovirus Gp157